MYHPWRHLRSLAAWTVRWASPLSGSRGECHWATKTITLDPRLLQAERRSVLAHELEHVDRGPMPGWARSREEEAVNALAARKLIEIRELGEALAWSLDPHEVADELWVDVPTVEARLRHLHPSEVHYLRRRLAAFDGPEATYAHQAQHARDPR